MHYVYVFADRCILYTSSALFCGIFGVFWLYIFFLADVTKLIAKDKTVLGKGGHVLNDGLKKGETSPLHKETSSSGKDVYVWNYEQYMAFISEKKKKSVNFV